jgi:dipeptidyl aminopeptidase/acylaminoacyl peptidase
MKVQLLPAVLVLLVTSALLAQAPEAARPAPAARAERTEPATAQELTAAQKYIDDVLWYMKVGDVAQIDNVRLASSKPIRMANATAQGAGNPLIIYAHTFIPKKLAGHKAPLIVFVHGGVHSNFASGYAHIVRELLDQGFIVIAPEYRGSTGFGREFYEQIDYGGAEVDDVHDVRDWAVANLPLVDATRVGIMGWSHGGYLTLLNIFRWPKDYKVAYAGVPVSDLVMRMGYKGPGYQREFATFMGKSAEDNPMEYRRRSPVFHATELQTPLLIHTNTNDEDVNVMEVEHLIAVLKAAGKTFEYKIYDNAPGGHLFNRIDTALARESRQEIYVFLARHLK